MLPPRILGLLVLLLAVQGLCKPTKSTEDLDYEDDTPFDEDDEEDSEDTDNPNNAEAPPQILSHTMNIRAKSGSTVELPCEVINIDNYAVAWMKDNNYLYVESQPHTNDSKRIVRLPNNSLVIKNVTVNDASDNYSCSILIKGGDIVLRHNLSVYQDQQPDFVTPRQSMVSIRVEPESKRVEVRQGESFRLGCETDVQPPLEIKWFYKSKKVNSSDPDVTLEGNYMTIKNVNKSNSGLYQCLAEDGSLKPAIEAITVTVHYEPEIEAKKIVHSGTGIESELTCIVSAYPQAVIEWYKKDKKITYKKGSIVLHHGTMKDNKTKHVLKILHTSRQDFGEYKCRAKNFYGQDTKFISLVGTPSEPKIYGAEMTNDDKGIILKWRLESYSPISEYKLQYRRKNDVNWTVVKPEVKDGKGNQFIVNYPIEELQPGSYEAILEAKNVFGWSPPSEPHMFTGDYPSEMARKEDGNSAAVQILSPGAFVTLILVVLSCAFTSV